MGRNFSSSSSSSSRGNGNFRPLLATERASFHSMSLSHEQGSLFAGLVARPTRPLRAPHELGDHPSLLLPTTTTTQEQRHFLLQVLICMRANPGINLSARELGLFFARWAPPALLGEMSFYTAYITPSTSGRMGRERRSVKGRGGGAKNGAKKVSLFPSSPPWAWISLLDGREREPSRVESI